MITRRSFLSAILATGVAPYVMRSGVASGVLMPVRKVIAPSQLYALGQWAIESEGYFDNFPIVEYSKPHEIQWTPYEIMLMRRENTAPLTFNKLPRIVLPF